MALNYLTSLSHLCSEVILLLAAAWLTIVNAFRDWDMNDAKGLLQREFEKTKEVALLTKSINRSDRLNDSHFPS